MLIAHPAQVPPNWWSPCLVPIRMSPIHCNQIAQTLQRTYPPYKTRIPSTYICLPLSPHQQESTITSKNTGLPEVRQVLA